MAEATIGLMGGSGFYQMEGLTSVREQAVSPPFGAPSDRGSPRPDHRQDQRSGQHLFRRRHGDARGVRRFILSRPE